jgi:REP element-mobilizing transposase RayT
MIVRKQERRSNGGHHTSAYPQRLDQLSFLRRGGKRAGAGRKPLGARASVSHKMRGPLPPRFPVLVTTRLRAGLPSLRRRDSFAVVQTALAACIARSDVHGMRLVHFSVQTNHIHLLVEARDACSLARGMQGLLLGLARRLNRLWRRRGSIVADHYHARSLRTPREVRHALAYVLNNARTHGCHLAGIDPFTSGLAFDGWKESSAGPPDKFECGGAPPVMTARTWLLSHGWRRHGLVAMAEIPGGQARRAPPAARWDRTAAPLATSRHAR